MAESFLDPQQIAQLHQLMDDGMATVQAFNREPIVIQLRGADETTGRMVDIGAPITAISLDFGLREGVLGRVQQLEQDFTDGTLVVWAETDPLPQPGYTFRWQGFVVSVERVYPPDQGTVTAEVRIQQVAP